MATLVCHIEVSRDIPDIIMPDGYKALMALVTFHGVPLGDINIPVESGNISSDFLMDRISSRFWEHIVYLRLQEMACPQNAPFVEGPPAVDVIVCTSGGRPEDLARCLDSIANTAYPHKSIIVVDNGPGDDATFKIAHSKGARYVREEKRGLDFARNAGLHAAAGDIAAFTDDDVVVDPKWLDCIVRVFADDPAIACVTGLTMPLEMNTPAQGLFERYCDGGLRRGYCRRVFDRSNLLPAGSGKVGAGANMAFRTSVIRQTGGFDEALDCGTPTMSGGDSDMFYRLLRDGYKICYEPAAVAWHRHREGMDDLRNQLAGYSTGVYALTTKYLLEYGDWKAFRAGCSWYLHHHVKNLVRCFTGKAPMPKSIIYSELGGPVRGPIAYFRSKAQTSRLSSVEKGHQGA